MIGAILVFFERSLTLGTDDREALQVLAAQSAMAIENAQRFERQLRVARSLQNGLLATDVRPLPGIAIGTVYEPATADAEVGGDFFDVFDLAEGNVGIVVGDVSGKGAEAAALTAQAKYMLRAFASRNASPSSALFHLNNALERSLSDDRFATGLFARLDVATKTMQISIAGHPPPLVFRRATGEVNSIETPGGLLGAFPDQQFEQAEFTLAPGDVFVACTDGLLEARRGRDMYGRTRMIEALAKLGPDMGAEQLADALYQDAQAFGAVKDDTVVFTLSFEDVD